MLQSLFSSINISASGLSAQRTRMNIISENIANAETTRTEDGTPYRRKLTLLEAGIPGKSFSEIITQNKIDMEETHPLHKEDEPFKRPDNQEKFGVHVSDIVKDQSPFRMVYDPYHPDSDVDGYVAKPNVNIVQEMTELINATRNFEANVTALNSSKEMIRNSFKIG